MNGKYSDHPALDFLDEEPTDPMAGFSAQAQQLGYETEGHWTQKLFEEVLDGEIVEVDGISYLIEAPIQ